MATAEQRITEHLPLWTAAIKRKSAAGRGSSRKVELYGVKKLRELILELAVRGLLVPQDPNDEPASELLKKIAAEKARFVKEGKIKKVNKLTPINDEEMYFNVPVQWEWCRLQDVCEYIQRGKGPIYANSGRVQVVSQKCVQWAGFDIAASRFVDDASLGGYNEERFLKNGDLLWNSTGTGTVGRINVLGDVAEGAFVADSHVTVVRALIVSPNYFSCFIWSPGVQARIEPTHEASLVSGSTQQVELNTSAVIALPVPVPPLAEQHRIVAKVTELMALCDQLEQQTDASLSAHQTLVATLLNALTSAADHAQFASSWQRIAAHFDTLFTTEESIDQLKQTILQLAVMGKLVPQDPNDEPASELLKKIVVEKAKLVKEGRIKKDKPLPPIADKEKTYEIPKSWQWIRSYQVAESRLGKMLDRAKNSGAAYPYLRNTNVQWHRFDLDDIKKINLEPHELNEYRLKDGDLLICEGGEPGRCAIWRSEKLEMYFQKALHRVRAFGGVLPEYIAVCLSVDAQSGRLEGFFTGATIKHFAGQELNRYFFALPPLPEQHRIIAKVNELLALCDQLKANLGQAQITQLHLADALAAQALAGA